MAFTLPRPRIVMLCGLLLCASSINYMDRLTLSILQPRILDEWHLSNAQLGSVEKAFSLAFSIGSLIFGFVADFFPVRWLYPLVLLAWSAAGVMTSFVENVDQLIFCRICLGFFEAGHWPCAIQTTLRALRPADRGLGNSVLQSGTSIGSVITPLVVPLIVTADLGGWRPPFLVLGLAGAGWAAAWLATVRDSDVAVPVERPVPLRAAVQEFFLLFWDRRFWLLLVIVVAINTTWQFFRNWLPLLMVKGRFYSNGEKDHFLVAYYIATDVGCLVAGLATKWLHDRGRSIYGSRRMVFTACAALCALSLVTPLLPTGNWLLAVWLLVGMGALGLFPCYYSFTQDLSVRHPAKVFGILSALAWAVTGPLHPLYGGWVDTLAKANNPRAYDYGLALVGLLPLLAALGLWLAWADASDSEPIAAPADR